MEGYMYKTNWVVYNSEFKIVKRVTLKHKDGGLYKEIEPFHKELTNQGLTAVRADTLNQEYLKGKTFRQRLIALGFI